MKLTIEGQVIPHKNTKRFTCTSGIPRAYYTKTYKRWEQDTLWLLKNAPKLNEKPPYRVVARFYLKDRRRRDISNLWQTVEDILVKAGIIPDDDYKTLSDTRLIFTGIDKTNPRVEIEIKPLCISS